MIVMEYQKVLIDIFNIFIEIKKRKETLPLQEMLHTNFFLLISEFY